jgi:hypothetical protein
MLYHGLIGQDSGYSLFRNVQPQCDGTDLDVVSAEVEVTISTPEGDSVWPAFGRAESWHLRRLHPIPVDIGASLLG